MNKKLARQKNLFKCMNISSNNKIFNTLSKGIIEWNVVAQGILAL